jgi:hypothetical protein
LTGAFEGDFIPPQSHALGGIVFGPDGNLFATSHASHEVLRFDGTTGNLIGTFVTSGAGGLNGPNGLRFGPDGYLYVVGNHNSNVLRYDGTTGAFVDEFVQAGSGGLDGPTNIAFGPDGNLYVTSSGSDQVLRYNRSNGAFIDAFATAGADGLDNPHCLQFGPAGRLYVCSAHTDEVLKYNEITGEFMGVFISSSCGLVYPRGLTFGPDNNAYAAGHSSDNIIRSDGITCDLFANVPEPLALVFFPGPTLVDIDIKPGSYPNAVNLGSHGLIPVAIFSSNDFDATTVDPDTVELAGSGVAVRGKSNKYMSHEEDVNGDGWVDLMLQAATANLAPEFLQNGETVLTGLTYSGQDIQGTDDVTIVP